jgi:hypothetical protein
VRLDNAAWGRDFLANRLFQRWGFMRKAIDTVPRNGDFVILEDDASGTYAVARWSAEVAQWLDDEGRPTQLNATHWHLPQTTLGSVNEIDSLAEPGASPAYGAFSDATPQQQHAAKQQKSPNASTGTVANGTLSRSKILSGGAPVSGWTAHRRRSIPTMAACLLAGVAIGPLLYHGDLGTLLNLRPVDAETQAGSKPLLRQDLERATKRASDATAARREAEQQAASLHEAGESASREKAAEDRTIVQLRQALQLELAKTEKLAGELAEAQRDSVVQAALAHKATDEAARAVAERERVTGELRQALKQQEDKTAQANLRTNEPVALKQERDKAEKLRVELAAARREAESRAAILRSASDEATRLKEANARATDELRQALRQAQDKADKLVGELTVARQEVEAQTAAARAASDDARRALEASKRSADEQGQALREAQGKAGKLAADLVAARQEAEAQAAAARAASDETRRALETSKRSADEQGQALREAQGKADKLAAELAEARRELKSQVSRATSARDQLAGVKEATERSADEQRHALQQERDKSEKLVAELTEARSGLEMLAKAKAAEEVARANKSAAVRSSVQKPKAEASSTVDQPSIAQASALEASTMPTAGPEPANPQAVRLIARANQLLEQGNIGGARNMLDRAAEMGSTEALLWLAETYDPLLLSARQTFGTQSDIAKARELYGKALAGGVSKAHVRLEALQQRTGAR